MRKLFILVFLSFLLTSCNMDFLLETPYASYEYDIKTDSLHKNGPLVTHAMPSTGDVKCLVVPINFDSSNKTDTYLDNIKTAFSASSDAIKYESVSSYYYKSSNGVLKLSFDVLDWYTPKSDQTYYESYSKKNVTGFDILCEEVLSFLDESIDFNEYDSDKDGYIDAIWLVYNKIADKSSDFWWAYTSLSDYNKTYDGLKTYAISFASTSFMKNSESYYVDASTYIHETGHLLGLDDYYSYNPSVYDPVFGADMMDSNLGDHCSLSKILLGWVKPTVVTESGDYVLNPFSSSDGSGNVLLVSNHPVKTIYDEYYLIDFYTPTNLNKNQGLFLGKLNQSSSGVRVYKVNANINFDSYNRPAISDDPYYSTAFKYNNSMLFNPIVKLLGAKVDKSYLSVYSNKIANSDFLYTEKSAQFGTEVWQDNKYIDGSKLNFSMKILSIADVANVTITLEV